ncbi:MAG: tetratricopeptide repeat protein [Kiritimatiellae bacterium]|nr:tetratricopeptide repeat protein [Kiritimatiellia bacterium]MDD4342538.1 tetratricopeptide repeat protein [Kiritimatiellia bacterium]
MNPLPSLILLFTLVIALTSAPPAAHAATPDHTRTFVEAASAYDDNRLPDAIAGWESLLNRGQVLPEVLFNLGNAYYRHGELGAAIRAYRHAQTLAPRDPDIRANLGFAAQTAGMTLPVRRLPARALLQASQREWRDIANVAFGLLFLALAFWMAWPRYRYISRPAAVVAALLLALAIAGLWAHRDLRQWPERVVMAPDQKVLSGPLDTSTPLLAIPEGAIVRQLDRRGPWLKIEYDSTRGWLPAASTATVL